MIRAQHSAPAFILRDGLFWACSINAPADRSLYFQHQGVWQQLCTQAHNDESTVRHGDDKFDQLAYRERCDRAEVLREVEAWRKLVKQ